MEAGRTVISIDYMWLSGKEGDGEEEGPGNSIVAMRCRDTELNWNRVLLKGGGPDSVKIVRDM
eukprot:2822625-Pyramimonas_sp.AAC.1